MEFKDKFSSILDETLEASKKIGKATLEATKETLENKLNDIEQNRIEKKEAKAEEKAVKKLFNSNKKIGDLQIDTTNKLFKVKNASCDKIFNFSDIIDFELLEDDISLASGGLGRALVGGVALGGAGAVVGAVTGKKTTKRKVTKLIVKITMNDFDFPCIMISLINKPIKNTSKDYQKLFNEAHQIISMLNVMVNNRDSEE